MSEKSSSGSERSLRAEFEVINRLGLHARAATQLVNLAGRFPCEIAISRAGQNANAKSVMGVLLMCGSQGTRLQFEATGVQAKEALEAIGALFANRFGEDE